jgi:hypothetical protein
LEWAGSLEAKGRVPTYSTNLAHVVENSSVVTWKGKNLAPNFDANNALDGQITLGALSSVEVCTHVQKQPKPIYILGHNAHVYSMCTCLKSYSCFKFRSWIQNVNF